MFLSRISSVFIVLSFSIGFVASDPQQRPTENIEHHLVERAAATLQFEGCFSDSENRILTNARKFTNGDNINNKCVDKCAEEGYAISSTKGSYCYCTNSLPMPLLYKPLQPQSSGTDGPCSTTCPGARIYGQNVGCQAEECCGGPSAYSVYLSGEIDVLKQVLRRITANEMDRLGLSAIRFDNSMCAPEVFEANYDFLCKYFEGYDNEFSYYEATAAGRSVNSEGIQGIQSCTLRTGVYLRRETYTCQDITSLPDKHVELEVKSFDKLIESEESIQEELATNYDIINDNLYGSTDLTLSKSYEVTTSFSESWSTEHGFDISVTVGAEFEAGTLFAKAKTTFELSVGYSFSSGYEKSKGQDVTESFSVKTVAAPGTKVETRFFKSQMPVQVKWRANIFANGYVHSREYVLTGQTNEVYKSLVEVLSYDSRKFFAFGTIDYGERKTMIARSKTVDADGNLISVNEENRDV